MGRKYIYMTLGWSIGRRRRGWDGKKAYIYMWVQVDLSEGEEEDGMGRKENKRMPVYSREDIRNNQLINSAIN